jgi:hypothetical protein
MSLFRLASDVSTVDELTSEKPQVIVVHTETTRGKGARAKDSVAVITNVKTLNSDTLAALSKRPVKRDALLGKADGTAAYAGNGAGNGGGGGGGQTAPQLLAAALGALTLWLPAEIITAYAAFVTLLNATKGAAPWLSGLLWIIALVATPLTLGLTAWAQRAPNVKRSEAGTIKLRWSVVLSPIAFVLWSAAVPNSAWNLLPWFQTSSAVALFALLVVTGLFTLVATRLTGATPATTTSST